MIQKGAEAAPLSPHATDSVARCWPAACQTPAPMRCRGHPVASYSPFNDATQKSVQKERKKTEEKIAQKIQNI